MHKICYRYNKSSDDEDLHNIELNNITKLVTEHLNITKIILTSRSGAKSALGLFQKHLIQQKIPFELPLLNEVNVGVSKIQINGRTIDIFVPLSTSPKVEISQKELVNMYRKCFV